MILASFISQDQTESIVCSTSESRAVEVRHYFLDYHQPIRTDLVRHYNLNVISVDTVQISHKQTNIESQVSGTCYTFPCFYFPWTLTSWGFSSVIGNSTMGALLWHDPDLDLRSEITRIMDHQRNRWIHSGQGFIGFLWGTVLFLLGRGGKGGACFTAFEGGGASQKQIKEKGGHVKYFSNT